MTQGSSIAKLGGGSVYDRAALAARGCAALLLALTMACSSSKDDNKRFRSHGTQAASGAGQQEPDVRSLGNVPPSNSTGEDTTAAVSTGAAASEEESTVKETPLTPRTILDYVFANELEPGTPWARQAEVRLRARFATWKAANAKDKMELRSVTCRSDALCQVVLFFSSETTADKVFGELRKNMLIEWQGYMKIFEFDEGQQELDNGKALHQLVYLIAPGYELRLDLNGLYSVDRLKQLEAEVQKKAADPSAADAGAPTDIAPPKKPAKPVRPPSKKSANL